MPVIGLDLKPGFALQISRLKLIITNNFPELWEPLEACLSVIAQLKIKKISNCFFLIFVGAPSGRKTTMLSWLYTHGICYLSDSFSPAAFVSHYAGVTEKKLKEIDLLPRVVGKVLITPDLLPVFDAPYETLLNNIGIMTRILDGQGFTKDSGVHGQRGYKGVEGSFVFHWIGAIAYIPHRLWRIFGNMGSREYFCILPKEKEKTPEELSKELTDEEFAAKSKTCRDAVHSFIDYLWNTYPNEVEWKKENDDREALTIISRLAVLLSSLRGNIEYQQITEVDEEGKTTEGAYTTPVIEEPHRANQVLYNFARAHALINGRKGVTKDDLPLVIKIALNSANTDRVRVFEFLLENNGEVSSKDIQDELNYSRTTALTTMESLKILGLTDTIKGNPGSEGGKPMYHTKLKGKFKWFVSQEFKALWRR